MKTVLWHIPASHFSEKARWALDLKGVPHERRTPIPGTHRAHVMALTRGRHARLPLLELGGERIGDSSAIVAALERAFPEPALYPTPRCGLGRSSSRSTSTSGSRRGSAGGCSSTRSTTPTPRSDRSHPRPGACSRAS